MTTAKDLWETIKVLGLSNDSLAIKAIESAIAATQPAESKACASVGVEPGSQVITLCGSARFERSGALRYTIVDLTKAAALASPAPSVGEPVTVEAVATVVRGDDGELRLNWLIEGSLSAMVEGEVLMISGGASLTDDEGRGEVYLTPPAAPAATEAPSDGDPSENLRKWAYEACKLLGGEDHEVRDRLRTALAASWAASKSALATPAPAVGASVQPVLASLSDEQSPVEHQGMTIAGDGAAMLGALMREQHASRLGVYPDGNPNAFDNNSTKDQP